MTKIYNHKLFLVYVLLFFFAAIIFKTTIIEAEDEERSIEVKTSEEIIQIEISSSPDFIKVKNAILFNDIKYLAHPGKLNQDIELSEIIVGDIDFSSKDVQEVDFEIERYADSKTVKTKIDTVIGQVKVQFIDTTAPEITLEKTSLTLEEGSKFNADDYLNDISDNSYDKVEVDIENNVDLDKPGDYEVVYTAVDSSENKSSETLKVTVEALPEPEPEPEPEVVRSSTAAPSSVSTPAPSAQPSVSAPVAQGSSDVYSALSIINSYRSQAGLHPLQMAGGSELAAANLRAAEARGYVSHTRPDGRSYRTAFTDRGLSHNMVIEVLVYYGSSVSDKVGWWMNSPVHRRVLMRSDITHIALGSSGGMLAGIVYY